MELRVGEGAGQGAGGEGRLPRKPKFEWYPVVIKPLGFGIRVIWV